MADISKVTLPNGVTYNIKDTVARSAASAGLSLVVVSTLPTAGSDTLGKIYLISHSHGTGDTYDEYVTVKSGTDASPQYTWEKIGNTDVDLSGYSQTGHTHSLTTNVTVGNLSFKPQGTVTSTFTGIPSNVTVSGTGTSTITVSPAASGNTTYTPSGSLSGISWGGSDSTFTGKFKPSGSITGATWAGSATTFSGKFTPSGTVSTPTISVANQSGSATTLYSMTGAGSKTDGSYTQSSFTAGTTAHTFSVADETLTIATGTAASYTKESVTLPTVTLPTRTQVTLSASQPTFTGTEGTVSTSGTPLGSISKQGTFTGTEGDISVSGTPNGSITSQGSFSGTGVRLTGSLNWSSGTMSGSFTPSGNITSTFSGTSDTLIPSVINNTVTTGVNSK